MPQRTVKHSSDLLGIGRLTIDAIAGVTDIAEGLHHAILNMGGVLDGPSNATDANELTPPRTRGITGLVYSSIRRINGLVGLGLDALIRRLTFSIGEQQSSAGRDAIVSALNGVLGDHLQKKQNPLAITMSLRRGGKPLAADELAEFMRQANGRVAVYVHGLCMNDVQWLRRGHNHGEALAADLGITPIYLRYNTGLHISENGRQLASLLQALVSQSPCPAELYLVAHSMGGLVSRSACYYAELSGQRWTEQLRKMIFLGTPHHGALLERGGNWIDVILDSNPFSAPFSRLGKIRSCGITDLRYGNIIDEDWNSRDRFDMAGDQRRPQQLPQNVSCYAIAASTIGDTENFSDDLLGDGLVAVDSALGEHKNPQCDLGLAAGNYWVGRGLNHMDLLNDPEVYRTLLKFMSRTERGLA
jgi:pimeloyl-ACP methyl ester carboxylesterase